MKLPYDECDPKSIEKYAENLKGRTFQDILNDYSKSEYFLNSIEENLVVDEQYTNNWVKEKIEQYNNPRNKGTLGNLIEEYFFLYKPNSDSDADFSKAETELKVTPYEIKRNGEYKAGERLVIGMISNTEPINPDFESSHLFKKLKLILFILYLREKNTKKRTEYSVEFVKLFSIMSKVCIDDLMVIKEDYRVICDKIMQGRAHELSEGDTRYLGACTKGASATKSLAKQYYSDIPAKRRAFSLKQNYMTYVINKYIIGNIDTYDSIFKCSKDKIKEFDDYIINKLNKYRGLSEQELYLKFEVSNCKNRNSILVNRILGVKTEKIEEFEKANIVIKTIRLNKKGLPKESMSFPAIKISKFIQEEFDESTIYNYFSDTRFLFVIFKEDEENIFRFKGAFFWNMPINELDTIGANEWRMYQSQIINGINFTITYQKNGKIVIKNSLIGEKETTIFHLRPHAQKTSYVINGQIYGSGRERDMDELPNGDKMTKQCFWLNKKYIANVIEKNL